MFAADAADGARLSRDGGFGGAAANLANLLAQALIFKLKAAAALLRFLFEDCVQSSCAAIFLIKRWRHLALQAKIFAMCSIGAGLMTSAISPVKECKNWMGSRSKIAAQGRDPEREAEAQKDWEEEEKRKLANEYVPLPQTAYGDPEPPSNVPDVRLDTFLQSYEVKHSYLIHFMLWCTNLLFWATMAAIPVVFDKDLQCDAAVPIGGHITFGVVSLLAVLVEVWVIRHTRRGQRLFKQCNMTLYGSVLFSLLGRFDTYSDVTTYKMLSDCDPITWFSINERKFVIPFGLELAQISFVALVVGVGLFQALPSIIMLTCKLSMPMTLKFGEFNMILAVMEIDAQESD